MHHRTQTTSAAHCVTPHWGKILVRTQKRVPFDARFCPSRRYNRKCGGMWIVCAADGKYSVRCIY
jgi:hypothetical protein